MCIETKVSVLKSAGPIFRQKFQAATAREHQALAIMGETL